MKGTQNTYADREIDEKFDFIRGALIRIEEQTIKTNGRVTKSEEDIVRINTNISNFKWVLGGAGALFLGFISALMKLSTF